MLNQVFPQQIQPQVQSSGQGKNDNVHSNKSESEQFDNILSREISAKESTSATETKKDASDRNNKSEETSTVSEKANTDNTTDAAHTNESAETNVTATTTTITTTTTINKSADNTHAANGVENQQLQGAQVTFTENSISVEIMPPFAPAENSTVLKTQVGLNDKSTGIMPGLGLATSALMQPIQAGLQQGSMQDLANGGNNPWLALQAGHSGDKSELSSFDAENGRNIFSRIGEIDSSINADSEIFSRIGEIDSSINADSDMPQYIGQPGLNGVTHSANQSALQTASHSVSLDTQMGQPKWGNDFAQKIVWLAHQQHQVAELKLNPAHLGPVEIMLSLGGDNGTQAAAQFVSPHLAVREAIEAALPRLREMMAESGIQLGDVMVGAESFQHNDKGEQYGHQHARHSNQIGGQDEPNAVVDARLVSTRHNGIVNTFA